MSGSLPWACGNLAPQPGTEPAPPCIERQSLNHWTDREVPSLNFFVRHWVKRAPCHLERCILTGGNLKTNEEGFFPTPMPSASGGEGVTPPDIVNKETGLRLVSLTQLLSLPRFHWPQRQTWWPVFSLSHTPKAALGDLSFPWNTLSSFKPQLTSTHTPNCNMWEEVCTVTGLTCHPTSSS